MIHSKRIKEKEEELKDPHQMECKELTIEELKANIARAANWKSSGSDKLCNFWTKQFKSGHESMTKGISQVLQIQSNPQTV